MRLLNSVKAERDGPIWGSPRLDLRGRQSLVMGHGTAQDSLKLTSDKRDGREAEECFQNESPRSSEIDLKSEDLRSENNDEKWEKETEMEGDNFSM